MLRGVTISIPNYRPYIKMITCSCTLGAGGGGGGGVGEVVVIYESVKGVACIRKRT